MIKILLKIILCFCILLIYSNVRTQQYDWLSNDLPGSRVLEIIERDQEVYVVVSNGAQFFYDSLMEFQLSVFEIEFPDPAEPSFLLYETTSIDYPEKYATIAVDFVKETGLWLIVQSAVISEGFQRYRVILCNDLFDIIAEQTIDTLGYPVPFHIDKYNGKTIVLGSLFAPPRNEIFHIEYRHDNPFELGAIQIAQSTPDKMFFISSMNIDERTGNMLTFYFNGLAVLDSTLYQLKKFDHTSHISIHHHGTLLDIEGYYYSHGCLRQGTGGRWLVFQKYDTLFNIITTDTFGIFGRDNYPFISKSLDYRSGELIMGGHFDGPLTNFNFDEVNKRFYMAKYDTDMNRIWYKEYGGNRPYVLYGLKLLEDGSVFAYGSIKDSIDHQNYAYIMHVDANGDFISSTTLIPENTLIKVVNPGNETLHILNPEGIISNIVMYDFNGHQVLNEEINNGTSEISTFGLPAGIYPYVIIQNGKQIGEGKWVKGK